VGFYLDGPMRSKRFGNEIYVNSEQADFIPESAIWSSLNLINIDNLLHLRSLRLFIEHETMIIKINKGKLF